MAVRCWQRLAAVMRHAYAYVYIMYIWAATALPARSHHAPCTMHHAPCTMPRHVPPRQVDGLVAALPRVFGPVKEKLLEKLLAQERRYLPPTRYDALTTTH